jgi:hypothetical protein
MQRYNSFILSDAVSRMVIDVVGIPSNSAIQVGSSTSRVVARNLSAAETSNRRAASHGRSALVRSPTLELANYRRS